MRRRLSGPPGRQPSHRSRGSDSRLYVIAYARMSTASAHAETYTAPEALGARVRALREAMDLSLRDLAVRSGVSAPMLSQVERGETSPTLQIATRIAHGLELRLSQLLRLDEDGAVSIVRGGERRVGPGGSTGHRYEILTPPLPGQRAELSRHQLAAGAVTGGPGDPADARARQPGDRAGGVRRGRAGLRRDPV